MLHGDAWGSVAKLAPAFETWRSLWAPLVAFVAFFLGRYTMPRSLRLYERAKFLHETTFVGDWRAPRDEAHVRAAADHPRLVEAARLYFEAWNIQSRLVKEAETTAEKHPHARNLIAIYCQFALLVLMTGNHAGAREFADLAVALARELVAESDDSNNRAILADAQASVELVEQVAAAHTRTETPP